MPVGQKMQTIGFFTKKVHAFLMGVLCPQLTISVTNGFQTNIEWLKMCLSNIFYVSDLLK